MIVTQSLNHSFIYQLSLLPDFKNHAQSNLFTTSTPNSHLKLPFSREGNYDEATSQSLHVCPGCGVCMQNSNPKHPGYFIKPSEKDLNYKMYTHLEPVAAEPECTPIQCSLSPTRFEHWIRQRAREGGIVKITSLHMVSALRDWGLKNLVDDIVGLAGSRRSVWTVGAQNAGKSTLINSIGKHVGGKITHLTEAPVPGTTLSIVRVEGALPSQAKLFDTPGLLHPYQITTRLLWEEQKLVYMTKELKPRTYRVKAGHLIHIAGLMRLDVEETSLDTIYVTVWASPYLLLHMGKVENATKMFQEHFGHQLQPPIEERRVEELGNWVRREFHVGGNSWDSSSVDIAAAGLGWFAIGLEGEAVLGVWTYEGVDVVHRNSLIPYRSNTFEVTGFTVSKIVSQSDRASNKPRQQNDKKTKWIESKPLSSTTPFSAFFKASSRSPTGKKSFRIWMKIGQGTKREHCVHKAKKKNSSTVNEVD
ncbi:unnamed protein product [Vicia faba]|uniref:G domain-containing protein n=1 Tax=Vicia faba TaxID=3906 RepID=A0AAV1AZV2_VICFA|nr:unnamed protein product [Vicia faba]